MRKRYDRDYQEKIRRQRDFERQILQYLKDHRDIPHNYDGLHTRFGPHRTAEIESVLDELRHWEHIKVDEDHNVTITDAGLQRLGRQD